MSALGQNGRACGTCHLADGSGRPENASPAGLPAAYITRQLMDFKAGRRHSADARKANTNTMIMLATAMSDTEVQQAADYFSAVKWRPHVTVVETAVVPATRIQGELFIPTAKKLTEPIGHRIIEVPTDTDVNQVLRSARGQGARAGSHPMISLMKRTVEKLTPDDIINITAYLASRPVPVQPAPVPQDLTLTQR